MYKEKAAYITAQKEGDFRHPNLVPGKLKPHQIVGRNINRLRNDRGLTQEALAEVVGIDRRSLQRIEAGTWNLTIDYADRFRTALKATWQDLLQGT